MSCIIELNNSKVYKALKKRFGTDETTAFAVWTVAFNEDDFTDKFKQWYKHKHNIDQDITYDTANPEDIVVDMVEYYNLKTPDGNDTILNKTNKTSRNYNSIADRHFCQRIVSSELLDIFRDRHYKKFIVGNLSRDEYIAAVRVQFAKRLFNMLGITEDELKARMNKQRLLNLASGHIHNGEQKEAALLLASYGEYINVAREMLGEDINVQQLNFLATFGEMIDSTINDSGVKVMTNFFNEVFDDSRLDLIRKDINNEFNTDEEEQAQDVENVLFGEDTQETDNVINEVFDVSFRVFENHDGQYSTFMTHIGGNLKTYFNCLRKLQGTGTVKGELYYATNSVINIADTMNANECSMILYTIGDYTNVESMIKSIQHIADTIPGFEGFSQFVKDLKADYDFAYEVYRTFGKMVIGKREVYKDDNGELKSRVTNNTASRTDALVFEYMNSLRSSSINMRREFAVKEVDKITAKIENIKKAITRKRKYNEKLKRNVDYDKTTYNYKKDKTELVAQFTENFKRYIPTIESSTILSFINANKINGVIDYVQNIEILRNALINIINGANSTYTNYLSRIADASKIHAQNRKLREDIEAGQYHAASEFGDPSSVWSEDIMTENNKAAAIALAKLLEPYSLVKTELNSRNSKGNLSSDVINSSMITHFMSMLQNSLNNTDDSNSPLRNYGKYKFRSKQYSLSNILVEKEKDGHRINRGLFKLVDGEYVPTSYATELIKMRLFNGISDYSSGKSEVYAGMSKGDYLATAMVDYFNSTKTDSNIEVTNYMMRIPSDAPKNFIISAPKYALNYRENNQDINFWYIKNEKDVNKRILEFINNIPSRDQDDYDIDEYALSGQDIDTSNAVDFLTGKTIHSFRITDKSALKIKKNSLIGYLTLNHNGNQFIVKGTLSEDRTKLTSVTLHGAVYDYGNAVAWNTELYSALIKYYKNALIKGELKMADGSTVQRKINKNHPIFQQMYYAFMQEMQDAATAIEHLFVHENGQVYINENGEPEFNANFKHIFNPDRATYANYHRKTNKYKDRNGKEHTESSIIQNVWIPVKDDAGNILHYEKTDQKRLSGNVFTTDHFTIFDEATGSERNILGEVISENRATSEDGKIHILYGGANTHLHVDNEGNIQFTKAQQALIEDKIEEFINLYIANTIERLTPYERLLEDIPHSEDDIAEFILNYRLTYINCNDLFEGNTKFYKNSQDFLKRSKEAQGSGVPYAIIDFTRPMFGQIHEPVKNSYLNSPEMQAIVGTLNNCKQFTTFRAATITNTIRTSEESQGIIVDKLTANFEKEGLDHKVARVKAENMMTGFKDTNVNDAQSYITFEEWIRRISARGQLHKYRPLIEAILDESKPLDVSVINEFIQVQKNFYYDMVYNDLTGVMAPRQIKNAEFVLVPRLIKGTELEQVYNIMIKHGIDQLNTEEASKAGKTNVLTLWDNHGELKQSWIDDFDTNVDDAIETFDYTFLYTQQETPQHLNSENKAGIQFLKKILDNIDINSPKELQDAKQDFLNTYAFNVFDSFRGLMKELGVDVNEDGTIPEDGLNGLDYTIFTEKLKHEMIRLGLDSNMLDFTTLVEDSVETKLGQNGQGFNTRMPAFLNANRKKLESISQAIFNNIVTRQKLPGFHAAQITNIGFKALNSQVTQHTYSNTLKYHPDGKPYIEIMLPASNFGLNRNDAMWDDIKKKYAEKGLSVEEIEAKIDEHMLNYLRNKGLDTVIGYRIPTEGKQSMCIMKVVGFTSDAYGSTIVVPDDWVAQTGSDFDIDSVYGIQYATRKEKDGFIEKIEFSENVENNYIRHILRQLSKEDREVFAATAYKEKFSYIKQLAKDNNLETFEDYSKKSLLDQNSRDARNNRLLDDIIKILSNPASLEENVSQSQFKTIIKNRDKIQSSSDKARRNARSTFDFLDQADYQEDAMSGIKLKAFSVILDTFCSVCNTVKPKFSNPIEIIYHGDNSRFLELQKRFDTKMSDGSWKGNVQYVGKGKILVKHETLGYSNDNRNVEGVLLTTYSSQTTAHILDAIKEGSIKNVNDLTFNIYKLFPNIGSDYATAISFMMQPGISEIVENHNRTKSIYIIDYDNPIDAAIRTISRRLKQTSLDTTIGEIEHILDDYIKTLSLDYDNVLDSKLLTERIKEEGKFSSPLERDVFDYLVVKKYRELSIIAAKIGAYTRVTNPDKFGAKQTIYATNKIFDDIKEILANSDTDVFASENGKSVLMRIYPGIENIKANGVEGYLQSTASDSVYPPLHAFLKYSTAASIKINSQLFVTQRPMFKYAVRQIVNVMKGDNPRVSEKTYNAFEKYILNHLYSKCRILSSQVGYKYGKGITTTNSDPAIEKERIFGYNHSPELKITTDDGNIVSFEPADINRPTENELKLFAQFTPAQKVYWIQEHFRDGLICKYLKTNLVNGRQYRKNRAGMQTIEFVEDGTDMEYIYNQFYNTFANSNPLLVLTAMDIVKYAFIVESFDIKRGAVNKIIDNDILINEKGLNGTGVIDSLKSIVTDFADNPDIGLINTLTEDFVRSHSAMPEIAHTYINKKDRAKYLKSHGNGVITLFDNDEFQNFILKHNIGYTKKNTIQVPMDDGEGGIRYDVAYREILEVNPYIKINYGKGNEVLYKVRKSEFSNTIYLTPLNLLQESESGTWSANSDYWKHMPADWYNDIIDDYEENHETWSIDNLLDYVKDNERYNDPKYAKPVKQTFKTNDDPIDDWDINDQNSSSISTLRTQIINHFDGTTSKMLVVENGLLEDKIPGFGIGKGLTKVVNGNAYQIYRLKTNSESERAGEEGFSINNYTSKRHYNKPIDPKHELFRELITNARLRGTRLNFVYAIVPYMGRKKAIDNDTRESSRTEFLVNVDKAIRRKAVNDVNQAAENYVNQTNRTGIDGTAKSIDNNLDNVIISTAEYVNAAIDKILNGQNSLNLFTEDPDTGELLSIIDPKVIDLIRQDPDLRRKYLKVLLEANHLIDTFEAFNTFKYTDDNAHLKYYVDKILDSIQKLSKSSVLDEAEKLYVTGYLAKITNNPNIKNDIVSLLDGFHSTSYLNSYLNDLQETNNPIIQIITNDVMSDIRAKEFQGEQRVREFKLFMIKVKSEAAKAGLNIDWDHIVDADGKFIIEYNEQFVSDLDQLVNDKDTAYENYKAAETHLDKSKAFEKYLKAKLKYDKFKLKHINQALVDEYYQKLIAYDESMIDSDTGSFNPIFIEYKMLQDRLRDVYSHLRYGNLDEHFEKEKQEILNAIKNLKADTIRTPFNDYIRKEDVEFLSTDPEVHYKQIVNSLSASSRLNNYINNVNALEDEYYTYTERFGFKDQLNRYLKVIRKYENTNRTEDELALIPEYVTAKDWVRQNATYQYSIYKKGVAPLTKKEVNDYLLRYYDGTFDPVDEDFQIVVRAALDYLKNTRGERNNKNAIYKRIAMQKDARDENGIIDGREFTDDEIKLIKEEQEVRFNIGESVPYSERSIIHNATTDDTIYTSDFYKGMQVNGITNQEYLKIVKEINYILREAVNPTTGIIDTTTLHIDQLNKLLELFGKLGYERTQQVFNYNNSITRKVGVTKKNVEAVKSFIDKNVEFVLSDEDRKQFEAQKANAKLEHDGLFYIAWCEVNQEWDETKQEFVPNHLLWGHAAPKSTLPKGERDNFISKHKTAAIRILNKVFTEKPTKYYYLQRDAIIDKYGANSPEFEAWIEQNHVYNPNTHKLEPLPCWTYSEPNDNMPGEWEPTYKMSSKEPSENYTNSKYKKGLGLAGNYKVTPDNEYNRNVTLNKYEQEVKDHIQELLAALSTTKKAKQYIEKGYLPSRAVNLDKKFKDVWLKELAKGFGYIENSIGYERWDNDIRYDTDYVPNMPMMSEIITPEMHLPPYRGMYKTDEEYAKAFKEYNDNKVKFEKENTELRRKILDHNWEDVISEFISKAAHYNAVQDNKYQLYFGQKLLNDILIYQTKSSNSNELQLDITLSSEGENVYMKEKDDNLQRQYTNWVRRVIFDQYKQRQGKKTRFMALAQSFTSTNYMTINVRGGISNVLVGESNIFGEVFAKEYFGTNDWLKGKARWMSNVGSFARNMYSDTSTTLADAIVKGFNVVDYDEITGRVTQVNLEEWSKRLRDAAFSPQTITEHFMQNAAMFSLMESHRIVPNPKADKPGEAKYTFMNEHEYLANSGEVALSKILDNDDALFTEYKKFIQSIKDNANKAKNYAWNKDNPTTHFVMSRLNASQQQEYIKLENEYRKQRKKDFRANPTVYSQFKLGSDGKLDFADDSILQQLNELKGNREISDAYKIMGRFKGRVISVNKKIHGNYGKLDASQIENQWWGGIVMQYHKHIVPGIAKRYRRKGYFNEERGTIEKGSYAALYDFLTMPIKIIAERNRLSEGQQDALIGLQNIFGSIVDYIKYLKLYKNVMPEYERANMRRILGDIGGMSVAIIMALLLRLGYDDDDDSIAYNLGLYEADRLATECFSWNPIGAYAEAKKLWSSPIAAESIFQDILNIMGTASGIILEGEDYDPYIHSGRYANRHKLGVYIERRIPYWRNWVAIRDIADNNSYYKLGDNILTVVPVKEIAENIKD